MNGIEGGVRLRLFLESFGLRLGCVHAQLPVNSRSHILAAFNKGLFDILIATGEGAAGSKGNGGWGVAESGWGWGQKVNGGLHWGLNCRYGSAQGGGE